MADPVRIAHRLRDAAFQLGTLEEDRLLDGIAAALDLWPGENGLAARAARDLARESGQEAGMLRLGLDRVVAAHSRDALGRWLTDARLEAARRVASAHPAGEAPALADLRGPTVIAQVLAGNVAGLAIPAALEALLARSAVLLKPAAGDAVTAALLVESLQRAAPELAAAVAVESWRGGDETRERSVFGAVDFVVASGGAEMMASLDRRLSLPHRIHGPRISIGVVGMDWLTAPAGWWERIGREIVLWDQAGCLSPRILFVAGDAKRFAGRLAESLAFWQVRWPAPPRDAALASAVHAFRAPYEMADHTHAGCIDPGDTAWTVVWDNDPTLDAGPPARVVRVTRRVERRELKELLERRRGWVQGMGTAFLTERELDWKRAGVWGEIGWLAPLDRIQDPPAGWRADGRSGLAELLAHQATRSARS